MAFPHCHKTVFVVDHGPFFLNSSQQSVEFDVFTKNRGHGIIPLAPISKTLWGCGIEGIIEYARIVYDIYPTERHIQVVTSDEKAHVLGSWNQQDQNVPQVMTLLAQHGAPSSKMAASGCNITHGLTEAVRILCEPTDIQTRESALLEEAGSSLINRGRIICLTNIKSEAHIHVLEDEVQSAIVEHNKLASAHESLFALAHCELEFIHAVPVGNESVIPHKPHKELSSVLSSTVHVTQSGRFVASKLVELATQHFNLSSTTVTGIPMKEEQNAASSANYDVELLHCADAHYETVKSGQADSLTIPSKEGLYTRTVTLKWCTPKSNAAVELQQCTGAYRITPVDVNSRPSSCLTNFLLSGRAVMLEQPRKTGARIISHMLASHGGEIYIHVLAINRSILEDPPSISEGFGGRITDYRINDFGELMKEARLAPVTDASSLEEAPIERAKAKLERMTRHWPMVIGDTIIFNMLSQLDPLPSLVIKENISDDELLECKKIIYHVVGMESRNEALPVPSTGVRGKGPKREEQYRQMWSEFEKLMKAHAENSPNHAKLLECLLECKRPSPDEARATTSPKKSGTTGDAGKAAPVKEEKPAMSDLERSLSDYEKYIKMTDREKQEWNSAEVKREADSPPASKKPKINWDVSKNSGPQSLLSMWTSRINTLHATRRNEFAGRLENTGNLAPLYINLEDKSKVTGTDQPAPTNGKKGITIKK